LGTIKVKQNNGFGVTGPSSNANICRFDVAMKPPILMQEIYGPK
jgi:hypothetical protein